MKLIILHAQQQIGNDRSIFGLYHILQGRPSIQTIQDAKLFHLSFLYGIYKNLRRTRYQIIVDDLVSEGYLSKSNDNRYFLTLKGRDWLKEQTKELKGFYLNGAQYGQQDRLFFKRIQLIIQIWTNKKKDNNQFIPVIEDKETTDWAKAFYYRTSSKIDIYLYHLYEELFELLSFLPSICSEIFVAQFSSYHLIGKTAEQLSLEHKLLKEDVYLVTTNVLHYLLEAVQIKHVHYPVLKVIASQLQQKKNTTQSAKTTGSYLKEGYSLTEISAIRSLKINTIYDHVVELAMQGSDTVNVYDYMDKDNIQKIEQAILKSGSYRLKAIKDAAGEGISYFHIRLVLAIQKQHTS